MAATVAIALVIEAMRKTVSGVIAAVWSKFADSATENAVFRPCAATQGMDSLLEVGYHIGGYGRWTGRSRLMTWS